MVEIDINKEIDDDSQFLDPQGYVDSITDEELVPDVLHQKPTLDEFEDCCVVVTGIPAIGAERISKLQAVLTKVIEKIDKRAKLFVPTNPEGGSVGVLFTEWPDKEVAEFAVAGLEGYALDKNHTFSAKLFSEMRNMKTVDPDWKTPEKTAYNDVGDLWWWMQNDRCRDQFAVQYDKIGVPTVSVYWHMKGHEPEIAGDPASVAERANWTESVFTWSPYGSYMATIHQRGVALWGGPKYARFQRFAHDAVQFIDFSPCETYLVTYAAPQDRGRWWEGEEDCLRVWDVRTGELKKSFSPFALTKRPQLPCWPFFKWSFDEKFFACLKAPEKDKLEKEKKIDGISVFETSTFNLVDRRHVLVENIKQFEWSPTQNVLAYYSECTDTLPAEFGLMQVPQQTKLRTARIHNVAEAQMFWQKSGRRLAAYTMRYNKKTLKESGELKYGGCSYHVEIFEIDKKDVSLMNLPLPEPFINFGWEPQGDKFCVLTGNQAKATPLVFKLEANGHAPKLMSKLDAGVQFNEVMFAPQGGWLAVLARLSTGGNVMFVDTTLSEAKRTNVVEHPQFNKGYWDPTGRYFVTCSTVGGRAGADHGFRIYTFQGRELCRKNMDRLSQFKWRPRPPAKLSEQKLKEIKKNLKKTSARFIKQDDEEKCRASQEVVEKRRKIMNTFNAVRNKNAAVMTSTRDKRIGLRGGVDTDAELNTDDFVEEEITIALSTTKTPAPLSEEDEAD
ncbi:unnamed protein product [Caenorhabditis auriculariae]|uniref:Eukaryotic translation initiation factor 3 subunit B n=1 Tax=Caenorhabditis auriculariae TaxID=2777116 RepID=A0A8S1HHY6_9PELO|nr:unnamed protein product [Caenorhabditis auriculariae]